GASSDVPKRMRTSVLLKRILAFQIRAIVMGASDAMRIRRIVAALGRKAIGRTTQKKRPHCRIVVNTQRPSKNHAAVRRLSIANDAKATNAVVLRISTTALALAPIPWW